MDKLAKHFRHASGFSTIELLIAMSIMIFVVSAISFTTFGNQNFVAVSQENSEAISKIQELLERTRASARKDFDVINGQAPKSDGYYTISSDVEPFGVDDFSSKIVTGRATWEDDSNISRKIEISTLLTNSDNSSPSKTCHSFLVGDWSDPKSKSFLFASLIPNDGLGTYNISNIDVYKNRIYVVTKESSKTYGPSNPSKVTNDSSYGTIAWNNPMNTNSSDGNYATAFMNGTESTNYLVAKNFGFNVPYGATILGINVEIQKSRSTGTNPSNEIVDDQIRIIRKDGSFGATNKSKSTSWPTAPSYYSYGNSADLWDESFTASDINNENFGVVVSARGVSMVGNNKIAKIDNMRITVTYIKQFYVINTNNEDSLTSAGEISSSGSINSVATGMNAVTTDGNYAYVATNSGPGLAGGQLEIIDIKSNPFAVVKRFSLPGNGVGNSVFYKNGYVYLGLTKNGVGPEFYIIDVHDPSNPSTVGVYTIDYDVNSIFIRGNYAYISHPTSSLASFKEQLTVLDITNPKFPTRASGYKALDIQGNGRDVVTVGNNLYIARSFTSTSNPEFSILDNTDPAKISENNQNTGALIGIKVSSSISKIIIKDYLAFLLTGTSGKPGKLQIFNISDPNNITSYASPITLANTQSGIFSESMDCEGDKIFISSTPISGAFANNSTLTIVSGS